MGMATPMMPTVVDRRIIRLCPPEARPEGRWATADDFVRYFGREPPPVWSGLVAEAGGQLVAFATIAHYPCFDENGKPLPWRCWLSLDTRSRLSPFMMHRVAIRALARLAEVGEPIVYALSDPRMPQADVWLRRLGFNIELNVKSIGGFPVWSKRLSNG